MLNTKNEQASGVSASGVPGPAAHDRVRAETIGVAADGPPPPDGDEVRRAIDRVSLAQALLDFEVANARVLDLTARLVEANTRVRQVHTDVERLNCELNALRQAHSNIEAERVAFQASRSYRLADRFLKLRAAIRG